MVLNLTNGILDCSKMLTTSNSQYLHPDYLQPLPTTLDAKKSPLALLAQTCSNIGKDISPSKSMIPPLDKKDGRVSTDDLRKSDDKLEKKEERKLSPIPKPVSPKVSAAKLEYKPDSPRDRDSLSQTRPRSVLSNTSPPPRTTTSPPVPSTSTESAKLETRTQTASLKATPVSLPTSSVATTAGHLPIDPHLYYSHAAALADPLYASALAHASLGLKPGELPHLGSVSPYVAYAQVKGANGATTLVPVCRDPYCTNCQLSLRGAQLPSSAGTCPAGCTQCSHDKTPLSHPPLPFLPLGLPNGLGSLYPSYLQPSAAHGLPYVCNWVSGSDHCGKRFSTSEDLLRHLRTHTSTTEASSSLPLSSYALPSSLSPYHAHLTAPSLSPNSLHRAYPTSLSPLSSNRFHPYKSSLSSLSSSSLSALPPSLPSIPFPGAYYNPYSALYGSRLGAAAVTP